MKNALGILKQFIPQDIDTEHKWPQMLALLAATMSAISVGIGFGWTSPTIPKLIGNTTSVPMHFEDTSYFAIIQSLGFLSTVPIFSILVNKIGRRKTVLLVYVLHFIAYFITGFAKTIAMFYVARFVAGIGDAAFFTAAPMYIAEITDHKSVQRIWEHALFINLYLGLFFVNVVGAYSTIKTAALICALVPLLNLLIFWAMPETPYYYLTKGRIQDARYSLQQLKWKRNVEEELASLADVVQRETAERGTVNDLLFSTSNRNALLISMGLRIGQQFCGFAAFVTYTQYIFKESGDHIPYQAASFIFTGLLVLMALLASLYVNHFPRRYLLILSSLGCTIVLFTQCVYFYLKGTNIDLTLFNWLSLTCMCVFTFAFCSGIGILSTVMFKELIPKNVAGKAALFLNSTFAICFLLVTKIFHTLAYNYGLFAPFCLFFACTFAHTVFVFFFVPETKENTPEQSQ